MTDSFPTHGRLAGIDYGHVRIGLSICDVSQTLSSPYETYARGNLEADAKRFQRWVNEEQIVGFVVGLPVHSSGEESKDSQEARRFGQWLGELTGLPVRFFDERYTTAEANRLLESSQLTKKRRKQRLDMLAAQIILAAYLESKGKGEDPPEALD